jgi:hypothetical protein
MAVCGFIPSFRKEAKGIVLSFGANERTKENIHPYQGLPLYWEDANRELQKPPILCGFWYRGTRDECLMLPHMRNEGIKIFWEVLGYV